MSIISQPLSIIIVLFSIVNIVIEKTRDLLLIETLIYTLLRREPNPIQDSTPIVSRKSRLADRAFL